MEAEGYTVLELRDRPKLTLFHVELFEAFLFLDRSRPCGFGPGFIQLAEMEAYARVFGHQRVADFVTVMRALDEVMMTHYASKSDGKT